MLGLIAVALIVLACSHRKSHGSAASGGELKDKETPVGDQGPQFLVIMAGDDKPTYLAKPISSPVQIGREEV